MLVELTSDQELFRATTRRYLDERCPPAALRSLRHDPLGFDPKFWKGGAELGWTSLLVDESHGGGSVSGAGLTDLTIVAHEMGRRAAPGPLLPVTVAAAAISRYGDASQREALLPGVLAGDTLAAWLPPVPGSAPGTVAEPQSGGWLLTGTVSPAEAAAAADHLVVPARTPGGDRYFVVPAGTPGLVVTPLRSVEVARRFARIGFDGVRLGPEAVLGQAPTGAGDELLAVGLVVQVAEMVGAMEASLQMTAAWASERYSFGRPLSSYQALKHRFADMRTWLEASHAIGDRAARAVDAGEAGAAQLARAAKAYVADRGVELVQDCVQIHGGIGVTDDHDLHLFLRRVAAGYALLGTPADHRRRLGALVAQGCGAEGSGAQGSGAQGSGAEVSGAEVSGAEGLAPGGGREAS